MYDPTIIRELKNILNASKGKVHVGSKYYYYKNPEKFYRVVEIALLQGEEMVTANDLNILVIYRAEFPELQGTTWARTLEDFTAKVESNGRMVQRFVPSA